MHVLLRDWSAWVPIALSLIVLSIFIFGIAVFGPPARTPDEGVGAHLFQIWLVSEAAMIGYCAVKWLPQKPYEALLILAMQLALVLAACFPVFYFKL